MYSDKSRTPALSQIKIGDGFWGHYKHIVREAMIPYQWQALNDEVPDAPPSHCLDNLRLAAEKNQKGQASQAFAGMVFQDSDLYKWLEAAACQLATTPDPRLEETVESVIDLIDRAQEPDGYLNTYYTLVDPEHKWTNLLDNHELYCSGHMIEAAVAWYEATGKSNFLAIAEKNARLLAKLFGPGPEQIKGYPGHPEIELALMRLYTATGSQAYLDLAAFFIVERGQAPLYFEQELAGRGDSASYWASQVIRPPLRYCMADKPLTEQENLEGHAVRALYLLSGLIDVALAKSDSHLMQAALRLWDHCVSRRMYITGGIGSTHHGEAFTFDYDLPNDTVYAETCASIALVFAARRMLQADLNSRYADVMERTLYNTCLAGMQLDGTRFLYVNPLSVRPEASEQHCDYWHVTPQRRKWFGCACCPPNLARLLASLGQYAYGQDGDSIHFHLYLASQASFDLAGQTVTVNCQTGYPADGRITIVKQGPACQLVLRIPDWCRTHHLSVNGQETETEIRNGYARVLCPEGKELIELTLDMQPFRVYARAAVAENAGKVCLQRGPLVYCLEEEDNGKQLWNRQLDEKAAIQQRFEVSLLGGVVTLQATGSRLVDCDDHLYHYRKQPEREPVPLTFIPYYAWGNRKTGEMTVWIQSTEK